GRGARTGGRRARARSRGGRAELETRCSDASSTLPPRARDGVGPEGDRHAGKEHGRPRRVREVLRELVTKRALLEPDPDALRDGGRTTTRTVKAATIAARSTA